MNSVTFYLLVLHAKKKDKETIRTEYVSVLQLHLLVPYTYTTHSYRPTHTQIQFLHLVPILWLLTDI